jgi:hypothetical protein
MPKPALTIPAGAIVKEKPVTSDFAKGIKRVFDVTFGKETREVVFFEDHVLQCSCNTVPCWHSAAVGDVIKAQGK